MKLRGMFVERSTFDLVDTGDGEKIEISGGERWGIQYCDWGDFRLVCGNRSCHKREYDVIRKEQVGNEKK